ncbi:hypothetical protein HB777_32230 [Mesorhizobium loti]|nr:hypothetical protein HB777_32230 [Mesorhizobium loti]
MNPLALSFFSPQAPGGRIRALGLRRISADGRSALPFSLRKNGNHRLFGSTEEFFIHPIVLAILLYRVRGD